MYLVYDDLNITSFIKIQRLKRVGRMLRMEDSGQSKSCTRVLPMECAQAAYDKHLLCSGPIDGWMDDSG